MDAKAVLMLNNLVKDNLPSVRRAYRTATFRTRRTMSRVEELSSEEYKHARSWMGNTYGVLRDKVEDVVNSETYSTVKEKVGGVIDNVKQEVIIQG